MNNPHILIYHIQPCGSLFNFNARGGLEGLLHSSEVGILFYYITLAGAGFQVILHKLVFTIAFRFAQFLVNQILLFAAPLVTQIATIIYRNIGSLGLLHLHLQLLLLLL